MWFELLLRRRNVSVVRKTYKLYQHVSSLSKKYGNVFFFLVQMFPAVMTTSGKCTHMVCARAPINIAGHSMANKRKREFFGFDIVIFSLENNSR